MRVAVIDYAGGNLASAARALAHAAVRARIDADILVTDSPAEVAAADRIVLPGQGAFADCHAGLTAIPGLLAAIEARTEAGIPYLGICVGMQLMAERGLEHRTTPGFGWIKGEIALMRPARAEPMRQPQPMRLPQIGWNRLDIATLHPLLDGISAGDHVYFVHSYALDGGRPDQTIASTPYGGQPRAALVAAGNRAGTQFHVEKSQEVGLRILANFLRWSPSGVPREGRA